MVKSQLALKETEGLFQRPDSDSSSSLITLVSVPLCESFGPLGNYEDGCPPKNPESNPSVSVRTLGSFPEPHLAHQGAADA